ncbi:Mbov_0401 family ICE element transposase-like protein [Spiroplasma endosymbiont of Virgichneumon dumeticola]|uniref:Mbov_0401 family ICE element transposase-like protein n=1 Tax=Spiroplasma endosymbiont of Virgichneumon dumeticola TaxID=3139323 RepID=UPI0035C89915
MLSLPFQNHFDWDKHHFNQDELNLKQTEELFKKIDDQLWNECDKSIYTPYRFRQRKLKSKKGLLTYKRRICVYYNQKIQKNEYISLLDFYLGVKKYSKLAPDVIKQILKYFTDGKRYRDICDTFIEDLISNSTVCRKFQKFQLPKINIPKIPLKSKQTLYINIDDGHRKFKFNDNHNSKNCKKCSMRLIAFCTGKKKNGKLINKRAACKIRLTKTKIGADKTAQLIKKYGNLFFENFDQANLIVCGDSAKWIRKTADILNAKFILDKFHAFHVLYLGIMAGRRKDKIAKLHCEYAQNLFAKGQYDELIDFLQSLTEKYKKIKVGYFINAKEGVLNQALVENIGCFTETNIKQILKHMIGSRTYNIDMYTKMVDFKCYKINTEIQLL